MLIITGKKCKIQKYCIALYTSVKYLLKTEIAWKWQGLGEKTIVRSINCYHFSVGQSAMYQKVQCNVIKDINFIGNKKVYKEGTAWKNYCFSTLKNLPTVEKLDPV